MEKFVFVYGHVDTLRKKVFEIFSVDLFKYFFFNDRFSDWWINFPEYWKNHPEVGEILHIQSRHQSDDASSSVFALSSDEEETAEYRDKKENSDSAEDSDDESDSEDSPEALAASNKFAALADSD